jgi:hypothetical protein
MVSTSWFARMHHRLSISRQQRRRPAASRRCRPRVEPLEVRELLSGASAATAQLQAAYGQIPLSFEANHGQTDPQVQYLARGQGYALFLTETEAVLTLQKPAATSASSAAGAVLRLQLIGANAAPPVQGLDPLAGTDNYFVGNDPAQWHTAIPTYGRVAYAGVYPGIDLVYYGNQQQLEYDFTIAPGADPGLIRLHVDGAQNLALDSQGDLVLHTAGGDVVEHAPVLYQQGAGGRQPIAGWFVPEGGDQVGFAVGAYDRSRPLIIDPTLSYSTYLGGSGHTVGTAIAVDAAGNAYVTGDTSSTNFPTTPGAFQTTLGGGGFTTNAFVTKLNATGTALVYSTYLGGSGLSEFGDRGTGIAVDAAGNAYVTGLTESSSFPTTPGAFQTHLGGSGAENAFVTKLNTSGTALVYSTYLGGNTGDEGFGIAVDASGNAYVTGQTNSRNFPTTPGAFQATYAGSGDTKAFVTKLNPAGTALVYSTYLGGSGAAGSGDSGAGIAVDAAGNAYIAGSTYSSDFPTTPGTFQASNRGFPNAFVTELNAAGTALVYSTYLGGSRSDFGTAIAVDTASNVYVTGFTQSSDFPTTPGAFQTTLGGGGDLNGDTNAFVTKLNATGTALVYSTYLGGSVSNPFYNGDLGLGIAVDGSGDAYVTGSTRSSNFPTTPGAFQTQLGGLDGNAFVTKLNATGTALVYSTYLGGSGGAGFGDVGTGIAVDAAGNAYVTGSTGSANFPTTPGAFQATLGGGTTDAFVAKFALGKPVHFFAVGGVPGRVLVYKPDNTLVADFAPYGPDYTGPVSVAVGDVNGDGVYDLVTGAATGNPDVHVYDGQAFANGTFDNTNPNASLIAQWFAYGLNFNVGANVAVGDIEHDGFAAIVTGATVGNPDVRVFRGKDIANHTFDPNSASLIAQWFPYALGFNVGANVAVGDVNGDGFADVVTGATAGNPDVRVFSGKDIAQGTFNPTGSSQLAQLFPYALNFDVGAFVAVGDTTGSGFGDVITGASTGNPDVRVFSGKDIAQGTFQPTGASQLDQFFAYGLNFNIGAAVASADFDNDGKFDILTGASAGAPHYRVVKGTATGIQPPALFEAIPSDLQGGIAVGA